MRLGSGERILISTKSAGCSNLEALVRGSSRCDDIRPIKEGYGSAGKGANDDHDLAGNAGARHLWSYSVARSQRVRVRQRRSPTFQRGLRVALSGLRRDHPILVFFLPLRALHLQPIALTRFCMGRGSSVETMPSRPRCLHSARRLFLKASE